MFRYEEYYDSISYQSQRKVEQMTGCKVPCTYQHYSLIDNPFTMHMGNYSYFTIAYVSTDRTLEEEVIKKTISVLKVLLVDPGADLPTRLPDQRVWRSSRPFPRVLLPRILWRAARSGG